MIQLIRTTLEARIAREQGKQVKRTTGYSNNEVVLVLKREFGIRPGPGGLESAGGIADKRRRMLNMLLLRQTCRYAVPHRST